MTTNPCSATGCERAVWARGMCNTHYKQWWEDNPHLVTRRPRRRAPRPYAPEPCEAEGCTATAIKYRPYCVKHYARKRRHGDINAAGVYPLGVPLAEKFARGNPVGLPASVCWEWQGSRAAETGYGVVGGGQLAHRVAYMLANGPIPDGLVVRHKCDNRPCVNPAHLEVGTHRDNSRDMVARGRHKGGARRYTDEQREWVRRAVATGMSASAAGRATGMSPQYVRALAKKAAA